MDDLELLKAYVERQDQEAFAELVRRHGRWLYSAARRQLGDGHLAEDVTQAVFVLLARRAGGLRGYRRLSGWLFVALGFCVRHTQRQRARTEQREREVATMRPETAEQPRWDDIAPLLESAVGRLTKADRDAVLLRFYEQRPLAEVGTALGISEEAARKRVDRAVDKLRSMLAKHGTPGTSAGLSAVLAVNIVQEMPASLIDSVIQAIGGGNAVAGGIAKGAMKMMTWAKVKVVAMVLAVAATLGGVGVAISGGAGSSPAAPPGPPFAVAPAVSDDSNSTGNLLLYGYSVGVEDPVAQQLRAGRTAAPGGGSYQVYLADAEEIRGILLREMAVGNVQPARSGNLSIGIGPTNPADINGWSVSFYNSASTHWGITGNAFFSPGSRIALDGTGNAVLNGSLQFRRISAADPRWRGAGRDLSSALMPLNVAIAPGQAAVAILDLGFVGKARRSHVVIFAPLRLSEEECATVADMEYPETYLRLGVPGIRQISQYGQQWRAAATQPSNPAPAAKWEQKLSDGTTIRLAAIGRPRHWPILMWNPDGNPMAPSCGWPDHDPTGGEHSSIEETVLRIEVSSPHPIGYGMNQMPGPRNPERYSGYQQASWNDSFSSLTVRMGAGSWQSAGIIKEGKTYTVGGTRVLIEKIEQDGGQRVRYRVLDRSELCLTFAAVSKTGERKWAEHCNYAFINGDGVKLRQDPTQYADRALVTMATSPHPEDDPIELLWRKAEMVQFDGFATRPGRLPPFDLGRDSRVVAKQEPTRMTTTRAAMADTPAADMKRMMEAGARGDVAAVEGYLMGDSPEQVRVFARFIARGQQAASEFEKRYGRPLGGKVGEVSLYLHRLTQEQEYALGDTGTASSGEVRFVKSGAGRWQADVSSGSENLGISEMEAIAGVIEHWLETLKAGEYADAEDAQTTLDEMAKAGVGAESKGARRR
jgi:RNA polymerase sigma factor (sigma-70 family)